MEEFTDLGFLVTNAGAIIMVTLIVQFLKLPLDKLWRVPTRFIVFAITLILLFCIRALMGPVDGKMILLTVLNSVIVTLACMGTYEVTFKVLEENVEEKEE